MPPKKGESPLAVKNWEHIRSITFARDCPTNYITGKDGDFVWAACPEGDKTCTVTITFSDGKTQEHTVKKGGGVERRGTTLDVWEKKVLKCD